MAIVQAFQGLRYHPEKVSIADVVAPPYDVIPPADQELFHRQSPYNVIRLILGKHRPADTETDNPHTRSAAYLRKWQEEGILVSDREPSLYVNAVDFPHRGCTVRRLGLIARVRLEPFEKKIILPHEKTFSTVKSERLGVMKACHANFSPIFSLYPDADGGMLGVLSETVAQMTPTLDFTGPQGHRHRLWRITDPVRHEQISARTADKQLFIADGHHRYETALNYRNWKASQVSNFSVNHPANFVMMCLCSMRDAGMVILPAHRLLTVNSGPSPEAFARHAAPFFEVLSLPISQTTGAELENRLSEGAGADRPPCRIGVCFHGHDQAFLLTLRDGVMQSEFGSCEDRELLDLDVTVLTRLLLDRIFGLTAEMRDDPAVIRHTSRTAEAMKETAAGRCNSCFLLNPTRIDQVRRVAGAGLVMPRKSTYFYPKVITGEVMNLLS